MCLSYLLSFLLVLMRLKCSSPCQSGLSLYDMFSGFFPQKCFVCSIVWGEPCVFVLASKFIYLSCKLANLSFLHAKVLILVIGCNQLLVIIRWYAVENTPYLHP